MRVLVLVTGVAITPWFFFLLVDQTPEVLLVVFLLMPVSQYRFDFPHSSPHFVDALRLDSIQSFELVRNGGSGVLLTRRQHLNLNR